jgi:predicted O-methyltransferase YrrM
MLMDRKKFRGEYLSKVLAPIDSKEHYKKYESGYWVKHQIAHHVNPKVIVEIGIRSGYSAWAMITAAPEARYIGYDSYSVDHMKTRGKDLNIPFEAHARSLIKAPHEIRVESTQVKGFVPEAADLYHVDGDHCYESALNDIRNCLRAGNPKSVVVVHDYMADPVRASVAQAAKEFDCVTYELIESRCGDGLMFRRHVPDWVRQIVTE